MSVEIPEGMCWPVLRLVNAGHDYSMIQRFWTLEMVLKANAAMDLAEQLRNKVRQKELENGSR